MKKTVPKESFFNFFDPPKTPQGEDEEVAEDVEERLELDYQLGEDIKEKLIPRAIDWFTGEALAFEELDEDELDGGDFEDEDDEEDDDGSDDRDEDEESDEEVPSTSITACKVTDTLIGRRRKAQARDSGVQAELAYRRALPRRCPESEGILESLSVLD